MKNTNDQLALKMRES